MGLYRIYKPEMRDWYISDEVSGSGYSRIDVSGDWWVNTTTGSASNSVNFIFPVATESWGINPNYAVLLNDASPSASPLMFSPLSSSLVIEKGDSFKINKETISITFSSIYSIWLSRKLLRHYLNNVIYYSPGSSIFLALYSASPSLADTGGTEISGSAGYSRIQVDDTGITSPCWVDPTNGSTTNLVPFTFSESVPVSWGSLVAVGARDHPTAGKLLLLGNIYPPVYVKTPDGFRFNNLDLSIYPYITPTVN
jgi:hypothetical protein